MAFLHLLLAKKNLGDFNVGDFFCSSCGADRPGVARPFSVLGEYLSEEVERGRDQQGVTNETPGTGIGGGPLLLIINTKEWLTSSSAQRSTSAMTRRLGGGGDLL